MRIPEKSTRDEHGQNENGSKSNLNGHRIRSTFDEPAIIATGPSKTRLETSKAPGQRGCGVNNLLRLEGTDWFSN